MKHSLIFGASLLFIIGSISAEPSSSAYKEKAQQMNLAADPAWLSLLHWHTNILFLKRSSIDDSAFFLSTKGASDAQAELNATLDAFFSTTTASDDSALCRYPARRDWLNEKLNFSSDIPTLHCDRYESWKAKMAPSGVSLIFASYYFNNPASMYGHTFLKLKRLGYEEGQGLLDYTVNYAAEANTTNGAAFAFKGLAGGYKGRFSTDPYYVKIQKYNNIESRDLWEYELNFSTGEMNRLIQHLWELGPISITYYFFNKNCSYQLLPLLEAARPSLNLSSRFRFRTVPLDTLLEALENPELVKKSTLRPSHVRLMLARRAELSPIETSLAEEMAFKDPKEPLARLESLPEDRQARVLDSAYDLVRYKAGFYRDRPIKFQEKEQELLVLRKDRPALKEEPRHFEKEVPSPQSGHGTGQGQVLFGADKNEGFEEISLRGALHDQEADPVGYVPGSQLEMLHLRGRYGNNSGKLNLEQFTLVEVFCLSPRDPWVHPPSWRVWTGIDVARDLNQNPRDSLNYGVKGGSGLSFFLTQQHSSMWYVLWRTEAGLGSGYDHGYRAGAGGQSGFLFPISKRLRFHLASDVLRFPIGHVSNVVRFYGAASWNLSKNSEVRLIAERQNGYSEARGGLTFYW